MIAIIVQKEEAGRKLARFLEKLFPKAPRSLFFKALRERKIKVNGKKPADLSLLLAQGDEVRVFFTEEQMTFFGFQQPTTKAGHLPSFAGSAGNLTVPVLYEDEQLLILDKPAGLLSQKSKADDVSLTEIGLRMMEERGLRFSAGYKPGVCNRLDRNTAGAVIMAKTLGASQAVACMLREKALGKYYWAIVKGTPEQWRKKMHLTHAFSKNEALNKAQLQPWKEGAGQKVESRVRLLRSGETESLVEIQLLTGKSHQIRAQLAFEGFPIVGDGKYDRDEKRFAPLLVARRLEFDHCPEPLTYMNHQVVEAAIPEAMQKHIKKNLHIMKR